MTLRSVCLAMLAAAVGLASSEPSMAAGPKVSLVVGGQAPPLEKLAARELAAQLERLYRAEATVVDRLPADEQTAAIVVGSPATNATTKAIAGAGWPKLSDQGHALKSVAFQGRTVLLVGGGSPAATLWAAYEWGGRQGVRYLLSGDVFPAQPKPFSLAGFDVVLEPNLRTRTWRTINDFPIGPESWGLEEQRRVLRQLAKLKFNRVLLSVYAWQPFVDFEFDGVKKRTALLWYGWKFRVDGNTPGRAAFKGQKEFANPDFAGKTRYEDLAAAGATLVRGIVEEAHSLGMTAALTTSPLEFPTEFAAVLPGAKTVHQLGSLTIGPGPQQAPDDSRLLELAAAQIDAYLDAYPGLDAVYLSLPEFPDWTEHAPAAWKRLCERAPALGQTSLDALVKSARERPLVASGDRGEQALRGNVAALDFFHSLLGRLHLERPGKRVEAVVTNIDPALYPWLGDALPPGTGALHFVDYTARRVARHDALLATVPAAKTPSSLILTLADDNVGVLPQGAGHDIERLLTRLRGLGWDGFSTRYWTIGETDAVLHYISRSSFDGGISLAAAYEDFISPMCGEGVAERVIQALDDVEKATHLIDDNDLGFAFPVPGVLMKHYQAEGPPPAWWKEAADLYTHAIDEFLRGHDRAHVNGRPYLRYMYKKCEFALEYLGAVEALRLAGEARRAGQADVQLAQLEKATEGLYNALSALGEVARDNSDRGVIAVLNEYGYRPVAEELRAVQDAADEQKSEK